MANRAGLLATSMLLLGCLDGVGSAVGDLSQEHVGYCAPPTVLSQPRRRIAEDSCWRVDVPEGFGLTELGGACQGAPRCLLTRSTRVERQLLDWEAEGEDNPFTWREVSCDEVCDESTD